MDELALLTQMRNCVCYGRSAFRSNYHYGIRVGHLSIYYVKSHVLVMYYGVLGSVIISYLSIYSSLKSDFKSLFSLGLSKNKSDLSVKIVFNQKLAGNSLLIELVYGRERETERWE